jgi:hypothetical protein
MDLVLSDELIVLWRRIGFWRGWDFWVLRKIIPYKGSSSV